MTAKDTRVVRLEHFRRCFPAHDIGDGTCVLEGERVTWQGERRTRRAGYYGNGMFRRYLDAKYVPYVRRGTILRQLDDDHFIVHCQQDNLTYSITNKHIIQVGE